MSEKGKKILFLSVSSLLPLLLGVIFLLSVGNVPEQYTALFPPPYTAPGRVFLLAWVPLYLLSGLSLGLMWRAAEKRMQRVAGTLVFAGQLAANYAWCVLFFKEENRWMALLAIAVWILFLVLCFAVFYRASKPASLLLLPYVAWLAYVTYLNVGFAILN